MTVIEQSGEIEPEKLSARTSCCRESHSETQTHQTPADGTANCGPGIWYTEV